LFTQFGVEKVSVNDIARKAGVSHATIYNNFGSKDALVQEYVTTMVEQLMGSAETILILDKPFDQKIAVLFQFITEMTGNSQPAINNPIFTSSVDLQNDLQIKRLRESAQEKMTQLIMQLVAEGKQQGQVNPDLSDESLAIYFSMFMDMFVRPEYQTQFRQNPKLITDLGSLMLHGFGK
jgi:AcrR family transcriptional regulator